MEDTREKKKTDRSARAADSRCGAYLDGRRNGRGYPDGLKGDEIPYLARIIAVADSYDAMTSTRSYRSHLPQDVVRSEIEKNLGTQFDPEIGKAMLEIMDSDTNYMLHE